jgi:hypothetical protein
MTIRKEILWESDSASDGEVRQMEVEFIRKLGKVKSTGAVRRQKPTQGDRGAAPHGSGAGAREGTRMVAAVSVDRHRGKISERDPCLAQPLD